MNTKNAWLTACSMRIPESTFRTIRKQGDEIKKSCRSTTRITASNVTEIGAPVMDKFKRFLIIWWNINTDVTFIYPWWLFLLRRRACLLNRMLLTQAQSGIVCCHCWVFRYFKGDHWFQDELRIHWVGAFSLCKETCPAWSCFSVFTLPTPPLSSHQFFFCKL